MPAPLTDIQKFHFQMLDAQKEKEIHKVWNEMKPLLSEEAKEGEISELARYEDFKNRLLREKFGIDFDSDCEKETSHE